MSTPDFSDRLSNQLDAAADAIDHGDGDAVLADVRSIVDRRRRRRQAVGGVFAAGALIASGAVVATVVSSDGSEELVLSAPATEPASEPTATSAPDDDASTGDVAPTATAPTEESDAPVDEEQPVVPAPDAPGVAPAGGTFPIRGASIDVVGEALTGDEFGQAFPSHLVAWNGGFLSVATTSEPQTLPIELPPEIAEQFPPEVLELFPDGLPPTIGEATEMLEAAGLYEVVSEIVLANPEVYDAIYAQPVNMSSTVTFSTDGETWEEIESDIPSGALQGGRLIAVGDRLVAANQEGDVVVVRSSTDLIEWDEQIVTVPQRPVDLPDVVRYDISVGQIVANADRWMLSISTFGGFDPSVGVEADLADLYNTGRVDTEFTDDGVNFIVGRGPIDEAGPDVEDDADVETIFVPWSDYGLDGMPDSDALFTSQRSTAQWGQAVEQAVDESTGGIGDRVLALDDGFVAFGEILQFSANGTEWTEIDSPFVGSVDWALATDAGFLVSARDDVGRTAAFAFDRAAETWTEVDLPIDSSGSISEDTAAGVTLLTDHGDPFDTLVAVELTTAEVDGFRFEQRIERGDDLTMGYTLTDTETGDVVATETLTAADGFGSAFEFVGPSVDEGNQSGLEVLDASTGEPIVVVPYDAMTWTQLGADGEQIDQEEIYANEDFEEPTVWVVAAAGEGVIVQELPTDESGMRYPYGVASDGKIVLVGFGDGTYARIDLT
ncbi:MAG: hypothetical protein WA964_19230 [Ilumatobacter sp.]|uniref:hypothetical protein n=1 Tax=Ilumatobacter sp. TaxID=1967498 RepID=UPI003C73593B